MDEHYSEDSDESDSEYGIRTYPFHDACDRLDAAQLRALLQVKSDPEVVAGRSNVNLDLHKRDRSGCTPLHVAILSGSLECLEALLEAGADMSKLCEGSSVLHMAVSMGALPQHEAFSSAAVLLLLQHGTVPYDRDDHGRTPLHWAAAHGLEQAASALLLSEAKMRAAQQGQAADGGNTTELPSLDLFQDKQGNTALHLAASFRQSSMVDLLLSQPSASSSHKRALATSTNRAGLLPIHAAAVAGCSTCCSLCYRAVSKSSDMLAVKDKKGLTAGDWARKHGHQALAKQLDDERLREQGSSDAQPSGSGVPDQQSLPAEDGVKPTLLVAPDECYSHRTCPEPITRSGEEPPPESVNRLKVLTHPANGILRSSEFSSLQWDERSEPGCMADILRVHDWSYVRSIQRLCASIPDIPSVVGHLDQDTAISHGTFRAAQVAVGGICRAVDQVVTGQVRNAFCAIRPPGHHAGPTGVVACANDPVGSHGFCLLNNIAIAAAYAMNAHRHAGIRRVALLDFDVHHGNGTEACVRETAPTLRKFDFKTPFSEGSQTFPVYSPWLDTDDADNILFASVQGYGEKSPGIGAFVYPGSGATCDTRPASASTTAVAVPGDAQPCDQPTMPEGEIVEDPDNEFETDADPKHGEGPRVINVGIPGPGAHVPMWKRAWRDKILPAVARFKPDIIFISAGFDAHRKDDINFRYIGIQEKEFEWLTEQLVSLANKYCKGRIVSALEGGYRIQGGIVSAFARSVASHVRALSAPSQAEWSWTDVQAEQQRERKRKAQLAQQEWQKQQAQAAQLAACQAEVFAEAAAVTDLAQQAVLHSRQLPSSQPVENMEVEQQALSHVGSPGGESESSGRKRRRTAVDYVALNKQLEAEAARSAGQSALQPGVNAATTPLTFVTNVPSAAVGVHATDGVPNQTPDSLQDGTALSVGQQHALLPQTREGDKTV